MFSADKLLTFEDLSNRPGPESIIEGTFNEGDTVILYADFGNAKTFIALDWAASIACGKSWQSRAVKQGKVLYVVAEGAFGFRERWEAWQSAWGHKTGENMRAYEEPVDLGNPVEVDALCDTVSEGGYTFVCFDTLSQCIAGMEENSAGAMSLAVKSMTQVVRATPERRGAVLSLHHSTKNGATMRGSSSLGGGANVIYTCSLDSANAITLQREKNKDGPRADLLSLRLTPFGKSCIVEAGGTSSGISEGSSTLLQVFSTCFSNLGCTRTQLINVAKERGMSQSAAYKNLNDLVERGILAQDGSSRSPRISTGPLYNST